MCAFKNIGQVGYFESVSSAYIKKQKNWDTQQHKLHSAES